MVPNYISYLIISLLLLILLAGAITITILVWKLIKAKKNINKKE